MVINFSLHDTKSNFKDGELGPVHMTTLVLSPKSFEVDRCNLNSLRACKLNLPLHIGPQVLSPEYNMTTLLVVRLKPTNFGNTD